MKTKNSQIYLFRVALASVFIIIASLIATPCFSQDNPDLDAKVRDFALKRYNGIPYFEAKKFDSQALPVLEELLNGPENEKYYSNIVETIGIIGDEKGLEILISFLEDRFEGEINVDQDIALYLVNVAIGHIAANGSRRAMDYLIACTNMTTLNNKKLKWYLANKHPTEWAPLNVITSSIAGLAITGSDEAEMVLKDMQKKLNGTKIYEKIKHHIEDNLRMNARVREHGSYAEYRKNIRKYYPDIMP
jgi:hypothetical protein